LATETEEKAVEALVQFGGCTKSRASELVTAWKKVFAAEALSVVAGTERVTSTVSDLRVERVRLLVNELGEGALPNPYELGVLLRVPVTQARRVLGNWQARYPEHYEDHMLRLASKGKKKVAGGEDELATWIVEYTDSEVLEYALDRLKRHGVQKGLKADRSELTLEVLQATKGFEGADALDLLGIPRK
jgi:hypothetical protein